MAWPKGGWWLGGKGTPHGSCRLLLTPGTLLVTAQTCVQCNYGVVEGGGGRGGIILRWVMQIAIGYDLDNNSGIFVSQS